MTVQTMRRVDALLGRVLCWLLTVHRHLREAFERRPAAGSPQKILFIKLIEQGATVLAHDALRAAIERVGRERVFFCVFAENRGIVDVLDLIPPENVFAIRNAGIAECAIDTLRAVRAIRDVRIDTAIDMEFFARTPAILAYLSGAVRRVGLHRFTEEGPYRGDLMTHRVIHNPFLHVAQAYRLLVDALDADPADQPLAKLPIADTGGALPRFVPRSAERARVSALIEEVVGGRPPGPVVLLNPNATDLVPLRKWPAECFIELAQRLLAERPDVTVLVTGSESERESVDGVCRRIGSPRARSLAGRTSFRALMVLYTLADVLVTNDSGPGHFSALTDIQSIVLFGPGSPRQYGPLGTRHLALSANLACSPCVNVINHRRSPCTDNRCMQAISVDEVLAAVHVRLPPRLAATASAAG